MYNCSGNTQMRTLAAAGTLFFLTFWIPPALSDHPQIRLAECEASLCGGLWTLNGHEGKAQWPSDIVAELSVERFDQGQVLIRRKDVAGPFVGLTAIYTGVLHDLRVEGDVTYSWSGHWSESKTSKWAAALDPDHATSGAATAPRPVAHPRGPIPNLNGVWLYTDRGSNGKQLSIAFALVQRAEDVTLVEMQTGLLQVVTFRGHLDSSTSISGQSCAAAFSALHPNCIPESRVTTTILDSTHLKDNFGAVLEKVAGPDDPRYTQALALLPPIGAKPFLPEPPFDLNGTWQSATQQGPAGRYTIVQKDNLVSSSPSLGGYPVFTGWYVHNPIVSGTARAKNSTVQAPRWTAASLFIENPDEISVNFENTTSLFYRASPPPANDLPCNSQNQFHVTRYYAWVRGRVAGAASDMLTARCWLTISADLGFAPGQSLLAALFMRSSPPDYPSAFRLASQAAAQGDVPGELQLAGLYREGKGTAPDAAKAQFWTVQAQRSQDLAIWQRLNTKNAVGLSMMDVMGLVGQMWETMVTTPLSPEAAAQIRDGEYKRRAELNRGFQ
jgi:hypothetical protein